MDANVGHPTTAGGGLFLTGGLPFARLVTPLKVTFCDRVLEWWNGFNHRYGIRRFALLVVLAMYSCIGALLFRYFEAGNEQLERLAFVNDSLTRRQQFVDEVLERMYSDCNSAAATSECSMNIVAKAIAQFDEQHVTRAETEWDFWHAMFYAFTIYTTIGYGSMYPKTLWGRMATIGYAIIGIPLLLTVLSNIGFWLFHLTKNTYNAVLHLLRSLRPWRTRRLGDSSQKKGFGASANSKTDHGRMSECDLQELPLGVAVFILFAYTVICAAIFNLWETDMGYATSVYFLFISLSTIGLGDVVPQHPKFTILASALILVGLALVSMCFSVLQSRFERAYEDAIETLLEHMDALSVLDPNVVDELENGHHDSRAFGSSACGVLGVPKGGRRGYSARPSLTPALGELGCQQRAFLNSFGGTIPFVRSGSRRSQGSQCSTAIGPDHHESFGSGHFGGLHGSFSSSNGRELPDQVTRILARTLSRVHSNKLLQQSLEDLRHRHSSQNLKHEDGSSIGSTVDLTQALPTVDYLGTEGLGFGGPEGIEFHVHSHVLDPVPEEQAENPTTNSNSRHASVDTECSEVFIEQNDVKL